MKEIQNNKNTSLSHNLLAYTAQNLPTKTPSVLDFGADPTGTTDSSEAFQKALYSGATFIFVPPPEPGKQYIVCDVIIPNGVTLFAYGAYFVDSPGAKWMFKLIGYSTRLLGAYISSALNCSEAAIIVENGRMVELQGIRVINSKNPFKTQTTATATSENCTSNVQWIDCYADTFTGIGFYVGPNCAETRAVNTYIDAGLVMGNEGLIPRAGTTGFYIEGTGSIFAYGGHSFTQCQASNAQDGWYMKNSSLLTLVGCISDDSSGRGYAFDGTTTTCMMDGCFCGPASYSIWAGSTAQCIWINGMMITDCGNIIDGYGSDFFTSSGNNGPCYNIYTQGSASITMNVASWCATQGQAHTYHQADKSAINFTGGEKVYFSSGCALENPGTYYIGPTGALSPDGQAGWIVPYNCVIQGFYCQFNIPPGDNGKYTYTLDVESYSTELKGTVTGSQCNLNITNGTQVGISTGSRVTLKVVTEGGASAAFHNGYLQLIPQP